jgi:NAD(P)H-quinone oxidoreductase subunit 3
VPKVVLDWLYVGVFAVVGIVLTVIPLVVVWLLAPRLSLPQKQLTYESGVIPFGQAWAQFNVRYYLFALIFVVFDVEAVFLLPWAVVFKRLGFLAFAEGLVFIAILVVALAYVWRKGDLEWVRAEDRGTA